MSSLNMKLAEMAKKEGAHKKSIGAALRIFRAAAKEDSRHPPETKKLLWELQKNLLELNRLCVRYRRLRRAGKIGKIDFYEGGWASPYPPVG
jgi:hypothetical protein